MARRNQFTVDAESVQGNAGAEVTFRKVTVAVRDRYLEDAEYGSLAVVREHILDWEGFVDDEDKPLLPPAEGGIEQLYFDEVGELAVLLFRGPTEVDQKN